MTTSLLGPRRGFTLVSRQWSWLFGLASAALPAGMFAYYNWQFRQLAALEPDRYLCGMPLLAALFLSALIAAVLSVAALAFGIRSYFSLARPRNRARLAEAIAMGSAVFAIAVAVAVGWLGSH